MKPSTFFVTILFAITVHAYVDQYGDFRCGVNFNNDICPGGGCCSQYGYCGVTESYCGDGCQSNCGIMLMYDKCQQDKQIALTFDDGPSDYTATLLNYLASKNVKATFFVMGSKMGTKTAKAVVKQASKAGHSIGVHTRSHPYLTTLSDANVRSEIQSTVDVIKATTGIAPTYFRPPYLDYDRRVHNIVTSMGYNTVMVGLDTFDWKYQATDPAKIYSAVDVALNTNISYVMLQHDTYKPSVDLVPKIIDNILRKGYTIVTMKQCIGV
jgi:peptidoglycan/xylan/chitin deacetylase (PgdA/CDA1 family)